MNGMKALLLVPALALALAGCTGTTSEWGATTSGGGTPPPPGGDTTAPTAPTSLAATVMGQTQIDLAWQVSSDNIGVTGYQVQRCQGTGCTTFTQISTPTGLSYSDTSLLAGTTYRYRVRATDAAGNLSGFSTPPASATTQAAPPGPGDTTPPTVPANLVATAVGEGQINLTWSASSDNVGVTGYRLERCEGAGCTTFAEIFAPSGVSHSDTSSLLPSTTYVYRVRAVDAAGNFSGYSLVASATTSAASGTTLPLGALVHDGPATPEQISLFLPVTGTLPQTATASVRYRPTGSPTWITGHPMFRIRPPFSTVPFQGTVPDAFAWPIIDVLPGTSYDIEVMVNSGAVSNVKTLTHTTRALPGPAGAPNKTIAAGSSSATIQTAFNNLVPGDVLQFANGTYNLASGLVLNRSGTVGSPIYIRGESRTGVVLSHASSVIQLQDASNIIIENLTIQGSGVDSGTNSSSKGISFVDTSPTQTRITVRNVIMNGVDRAIYALQEIAEFLAYDNTLNGNNTWTPALLDTNATWNDDGINIPGFGNCAFNNTMRGFGDSLAYAQHSGNDTLTQAVGVHFYRNEIRQTGDDFAEGDHSHRNNTLYDNRVHNSSTFLSLDPLYGGPFLAARNISINTARSPLKFNDQNSGQFLYNNTIVRTNAKAGTAHDGWGQAQFNNGEQQAFGYRNNLFVYRGNTSSGLFAWEPGINNPIDFTHNSWYPDDSVWWTNSGGAFGSLAAAFAGLPATTPVFSGATKRHQNDNISISNPWTVTITLGADYTTEITTIYTPILSPGTSPKNSGVAIPNITDGFSGGAPDRGAIIEGRTPVVYGDRTP